jgi:hypothetical protein
MNSHKRQHPLLIGRDSYNVMFASHVDLYNKLPLFIFLLIQQARHSSIRELI